jgi:DNA uptake protein ComE-like DNA-binding protein
MKSFLVGLGLGVAVAVVLRQRGQSTGRKTSRMSPTLASRGGRSERRTNSAISRPKGRGQPREMVAAAEVSSSRSEAASGKSALSPEEVLNSATRQQLLSVYGIGPVLADRIIQNRPYAAVYDVVKQGIIPESLFVQLRKQLL